MTAVTQTQIANRALMKVGSMRIAAGAFLTENSLAADTLRACYDIVRRAELERNVWRFSIRTLALRAIDNDMKNVTFAAWASGTTYKQSDVALGSDNQLYLALVGSNTGNDPTLTSGKWSLYFGPSIAIQYIAAFLIGTTYSVGQYVTGSNGTVYTSLVNANVGNDPTTDAGVHWAVATNREANNSYYAGELVYTLTSPQVVYMSLVNNNLTNPITDTTSSWLAFTTQPALSAISFVYPIGSGPGSETTTRNVYFLPNGFMRKAAQDPKAQQNAFLGGPTGLRYDDWYFENNYLTSFEPGPILFRFAADVSDPSQMSPLFVEGFACRLALEIAEPLTQSAEKINGIEQQYRKFMGEARTVNGIETGTEDPPIDEYLAVRV